LLFSIGDITFNLADVVTARKVNSDIPLELVGTTKHPKFVFFIVKLSNGDELHCCKDSPTYEEFLEAWSEVVPKYKPKHNVSHKLPQPSKRDGGRLCHTY